jgi:hypothetical protein
VPATTPGATDSIQTTAEVTGVEETLVNPDDDAASVVTSVVSPASAPPTIQTGLLANFQNSLIEQALRVTNQNPQAIPAFRILVGNLPVDVTVFNAQGITAAGVPYLLVSEGLAATESATFTVQFHRANGMADFTPTYTLELLTKAEADALLAPEPPGPRLAITRIVARADASMLIEWESVPGRSYLVLYSDDLTTFRTVLPTVNAVANRTQWVDAGPPHTHSHPSKAGMRFYTVVEQP